MSELFVSHRHLINGRAPRAFREGDRVRVVSPQFFGHLEGEVCMLSEREDAPRGATVCVSNRGGNVWFRPDELELLEATSATEALEDALEREPERPTRFKCPHCQREHTEQQWQCLTWLQFAGAIRSGRLLVSAEVRRCVCSNPIARECVLPMVEVLP